MRFLQIMTSRAQFQSRIMYLPGCDKTMSNDERDSDFVCAVVSAQAAAVFTRVFLNSTYDT